MPAERADVIAEAEQSTDRRVVAILAEGALQVPVGAQFPKVADKHVVVAEARRNVVDDGYEIRAGRAPVMAPLRSKTLSVAVVRVIGSAR